MDSIYSVKIKDGTYSGFLIRRTAKLLLIQELRDFFDEGFSLFVRRRILDFKPIDKSHVVYAGVRIHRIKKRKAPIRLKRFNLQGVLDFLSKTNQVVLVDYNEQKTNSYFIGTIDSVEKEACRGRFYHVNGKLGAPEVIQFKSITRVQWGDRYTLTLKRLLRSQAR